MHPWLLGLVAVVLIAPTVFAAPSESGTPLIATDTARFSVPDKAHLEAVPGPHGPALKFSFDDDNKNVFVQGRGAGGDPSWDQAAGFSFWVKGDGSNHLGGIEFIWNGDYGQRYGYAFPINSTAWTKVVVPWRDLIPERSDIALPIDLKASNAPSKLGQITFGKWWYWKDYAPYSYTIEDIRLEPVIKLDNREFRPAGAPLARTLAKLRAGKPITLVTMGDSLTDFAHWSNHGTNWPTELMTRIKQKYGSTVTLVNPSMGGTELRQNLVVLPRWTSTTPRPDLVTIFFGGNDYSNGMRHDRFVTVVQDAIDRVRRATSGKADVLVMTTAPPLKDGETMAELAAACREAAASRHAGVADIYSAFGAVPAADRPKLNAWDGIHLGLPGQQLVAQTGLAAIESAHAHP